MQNIILAIPHASMYGVFDKIIGKWSCNAYFVNDYLLKHTDLYTDMLFMPQDLHDGRINAVVCKYSRFVCDVERLDKDPLDEIGQGVLYTKFGGYARGTLDNRTKMYLINKVKGAYLSRLKEGINDGGGTLIIDCHSFNSKIDENTDICIGFNDDFTYSEEVVNIINKGFKDYGYKVSLNKPCANSIAPTTLKQYKSVMIEVNKRVYMNENLNTLNVNARQWMRWYGCLEKIYSKLLLA